MQRASAPELEHSQRPEPQHTPAAPRWYAWAIWLMAAAGLLLVLWVNRSAVAIMFTRHGLWGRLIATAAVLTALLRPGGRVWTVSSRQWLAGVLALAFAVRLACVLTIPYEPKADFKVYHDAGVRMAENWRLAIGCYRCFFPPGQIFSLGVVYALFNNSVKAAQVLNVVWATLTVAGVWYIGRQLAGEAAGRAASLLAALMPSTIFSCMVLGAEVPQNFWFVLGLCFYLAGVSRRSLWPALACGICLGVASLIRPTFVLVPIALALHMLLSWPRRTKAILTALVILGGLALVVSPWTYRNYRVTGGFILISSNGGGNLYSGNNDETEGRYTDSAWQHVFDNSPDDLTLQRLGKDLAVNWIRRNPGRFVQLAVNKAAIFWRRDVDMTWWALVQPQIVNPRFSGQAMAASDVFYVLCLVACLAGLLRHRRRLWANRPWMVLPVMGMYFTAVHMVFESQAKYHYMLAPLLCVLAAFIVGPSLIGAAGRAASELSATRAEATDQAGADDAAPEQAAAGIS